MKRTLLSLTLLSLSTATLASVPASPSSMILEAKNPQTLTVNQIADLEGILSDEGAKAIYLSRDCDKPIDADKFYEMAKLKALSEGFPTSNGIDRENTRRKAHVKYGQLKSEAPLGELCTQYKADIEGKYRWLSSEPTLLKSSD